MKRLIATVLVLLALALHMGGVVSVAAQAGAGQATAQPTEVDSAPRFAIRAVGNHSDGFFRDVPLAPGESLDLTIEVFNFGEVPIDLRVFKADALSALNGGYVSGDSDVSINGHTEWVDFPTVEVALEPGAQELIAFTVTVPEDAATGQYITGLVAETAEPLAIPGSTELNQVLGYAISVGILVPGEIEHGFTLGEADTEARRIDVPISNTGNYLVRPAGRLTLTDTGGVIVHTEDIQMGSVYAGLSTLVSVVLPDPVPAGEYTLDLTLTDEASGVVDNIAGQQITLSEPVDPSGVNVEASSVTPNADPIAFADVALTITNGGPSIPAADIALEVARDGEPVETYPLATNQVLPSGPTEITERYIPATDWAPGTWTFRVVVSAVDPESETATALGTFDLDDEITVP